MPKPLHLSTFYANYTVALHHSFNIRIFVQFFFLLTGGEDNNEWSHLVVIIVGCVAVICQVAAAAIAVNIYRKRRGKFQFTLLPCTHKMPLGQGCPIYAFNQSSKKVSLSKLEIHTVAD